jgi:hypothetical protein
LLDSEPDANALLKRSGLISVAPLRAPSRSGVTLRQRKRADSKIRDVREVFTHKHDFSAINALETGAKLRLRQTERTSAVAASLNIFDLQSPLLLKHLDQNRWRFGAGGDGVGSALAQESSWI